MIKDLMPLGPAQAENDLDEPAFLLPATALLSYARTKRDAGARRHAMPSPPACTLLGPGWAMALTPTGRLASSCRRRLLRAGSIECSLELPDELYDPIYRVLRG